MKEGGGTLLQQIGAALGAMTGLLASKWGVPTTGSVITGAIVGATLGSIGKGFVAASLDQIRERREQRIAKQGTTGRSGAGIRRGIGHRHGSRSAGESKINGGSTTRSGGRGGTPSMMNQMIEKLEQVIEQFDRAGTQLHALMTEMWATQNRISGALAGGRVDVVRQTHDRLEGARHRVHDAANLAQEAADDVRAYRSGL